MDSAELSVSVQSGQSWTTRDRDSDVWFLTGWAGWGVWFDDCPLPSLLRKFRVDGQDVQSAPGGRPAPAPIWSPLMTGGLSEAPLVLLAVFRRAQLFWRPLPHS